MKAEVKSDIAQMAKIYNTYNCDWLGEKIYTIEQLTRHHILKKQYGGEDSFQNYALLTKTSHAFIHFLEDNYNSDYKELNSLFLELNKSNLPPTDEYFTKVGKIVKRVKKQEKNKNRKSK